MMQRWLAGILIAGLTMGLAVAQEFEDADTAAPEDDTAPVDSMLEDTGDTGDTAAVEDTMLSEDTGEPAEDTGDTGDTAEIDPCEGLGLFVGDLVFSTQRALDAFGNDYDRVNGDLRVVGGEIQDLSPLDCLAEVEGDFTLSAQGEVAPLERLTRVGGAFRVIQTPMAELHLPALITAQSLEVEANPGLTSIDAPLLSTRAVVLSQMPKLTRLNLPLQALPDGLVMTKTGLSKPPEALVAGRIVLEENPRLRDLSPLAAVGATDELVVSQNPSLTSIDLPNLAVVRGELFIRDNGLRDMSGLSSLAVAGNVSVLDHASMTRVGLPALVVTGELRVERNAVLGSLDLDELTRVDRLLVKECPSFVAFGLPQWVKGSLELTGLRSLTSLDGLVLLSMDEVVLKGNSALKDISALEAARVGRVEAEGNKKLKPAQLERLTASD
jgi:hypothetical protein